MTRIHNVTRGTALADQARRADTAWARMRGLLGTDGLESGEGLVIVPCNSVHMFWMRYPLDVVFASVSGEVIGVVENLRPWRMTRVYWGARYAIELPVGVIAASGTCPGDVLEINTSDAVAS